MTHLGPYELDRVHLGDCIELMKQLPDKCVDCVVTDPPYGVRRDKGFEGFEGFGGFGKPIARRRYEDENWDFDRPTKECFDLMLSISKSCLVFGGNYFADILPQGKPWIFWDKVQTMPTFGDGELIWTNIKRNSVTKKVFEWNGLIGKEEFRFHPTQKPVDLMKWVIDKYTEPNALILDPFSGSGTTGVAAIQTGRRFLGFEIDPRWCDIANKRIEAAKAQQVLDLDLSKQRASRESST